MDTLSVLKILKTEGGFDEVHHISHFRCYRKGKKVDVEITDMGDENPNARFQVMANQEDDKTASGNPGGTIHEALHQVHWFNLD